MKKYLALLLVPVLLAVLAIGSYKQFTPFEPQAKAATGAIFAMDGRFHCSGTEIGSTTDGDGIFLTARHCVADPETNKVSERLMVSFSDNQGGPYYLAQPIAISLTDDLALLLLRNGGSQPQVRVRDERSLHGGDPIFNVSFPLGFGKQMFHGEYMRPDFPTLPMDLLQQYPMWIHAMPMNMTIAHGSSGSGVFSNKQRALIGVVVATFQEGSFTGAIPGDRVLDFLNDLQDNTVTKFMYAHPEHEAPPDWF